MTAFARRLKQLRKEAALTKYALAKKAGLTWQALSLLESGKSNPTWDTVQRLAAALNVPTDAFAEPDFQLPEPEPPRPRGRPRKEPPKGGPNK